MLTATCHCGAVAVEMPRKPRTLTNCNCSICRRHGALWAYYKMSDVQVHAAPQATEAYVWGDRSLRIVRCRGCGCVTHWQPIQASPDRRMGVNARNMAPEALGTVRIRRLDGASSWKYLD